MVLSLIILVLSSVTLISTIVVLIYSALNWKKSHHFFLACFFICLIFYYLPFLLSNLKLLRYVPHVLKSGVIFYYMIPGFLILYLKSFLTKSLYLRKKHLLFLIVPFIVFLDYLYFHIQNSSQLDEIVKMIEQKNMYIIRIEGFIPFEINLLLRFIYIFPFSIYVLRLSIKQGKKTNSTTEEKKIFTFLNYLLFIVFYAFIFFLTSQIIPFLGNKIVFNDTLNSGMLILAGTIIVFISMSILLSPELLFDVKEKDKKVGKIIKESIEESTQMLNAIESKMVEEKFYLNENFSSQDVLVHFDITRNKLDELLTHIKGLSFADWINTLRIEYAKNLLLTHNKYTIDAISSISGFNSRSAFYAAFKKVTNITPTEFIRQVKNNSEETKSE
jgi:AraC-like DNA-binding protein